MRAAAIALAAAVALATATPVAAQTAPSASEIARYAGLHAAAQRGDLPALQQALAVKADVDARDGRGRTPLHVATFARQRDAIRALAKAGAGLGALENDRYDAVTIASVADDTLLEAGAST